MVPLDPRQTLTEFGGAGLRSLPGLLERLRDRVQDGGSGDPPIHVVVDDYDLAASALAPLADVLPHARDVGLHLFIARRSGGAARALYDPVLSALRETGSVGLQMSGSPDDGPLVGGVRPRPLPPGRGVLVTRAGARTDHPGGLDGIVGVPMTVVCEVGPGVVRLLQPGPGPCAVPALVETVLDAGGEPLALLDDRPVATAALWRTVFEALLDGADAAQLVHPSWWSPRRVGAVAGAARGVVDTVTTSPRHRLLHRGAVFVEIGPDFVAIGDHQGVTGAETRWAEADIVADAVAGRVGGDGGAVHIDAPVGVPGAGALGSLIARRLHAAGRTVRQLADHELCAAAARSARPHSRGTATGRSGAPAQGTGRGSGDRSGRDDGDRGRRVGRVAPDRNARNGTRRRPGGRADTGRLVGAADHRRAWIRAGAGGVAGGPRRDPAHHPVARADG